MNESSEGEERAEGEQRSGQERRADVREVQAQAAEEKRLNRIRRVLVYSSLVGLTVLVLLALYGAFVTGPSERDDIRESQEKTDTLTDQLSKSNAGLTALFCTAANRGDTLDQATIRVLVKEEARDVDGENDLTDSLTALAKEIPPKTNCGELICQFFREVAEPGAEIVIRDPFGPDRPRKPCGEAPEQKG